MNETLSLSLVIPTRNETGNIPTLFSELYKFLDPATQIIIVDDSDDDTPSVAGETARDYPFETNIIARSREERAGGLSTAVVRGIKEASGTYVSVMDADLQHPPATLPIMLNRAIAADLDLVISSRYIQGGGSEGLSSPSRKLISRATGEIARALFPRIRQIKDPMSGYFMFNKRILDPQTELAPQGFKILLEILVKSNWKLAEEVPYVFRMRHDGESKANFKQGVDYAKHLALLLKYQFARKIRGL